MLDYLLLPWLSWFWCYICEGTAILKAVETIPLGSRAIHKWVLMFICISHGFLCVIITNVIIEAGLKKTQHCDQVVFKPWPFDMEHRTLSLSLLHIPNLFFCQIYINPCSYVLPLLITGIWRNSWWREVWYN